MIVVTGSSRTGTSLMMLILKMLGIPVTAPAFEKWHDRIRGFNPNGFFEITGKWLRGGIQDDSYRGQAIKLFGEPLHNTPSKLISKLIVCRRSRDKAVESSRPVFNLLYNGRALPGGMSAEQVYDSNFHLIHQKQRS